MVYKHCVTEDASRRQQKVEDCLYSNMLRIPYDQISVSDLCQQVGISRKAFYRYFKNKNACLCALLDRKLLDERAYKIAVESIATSSPAEISTFLAFWKAESQLLDVLVKNDLIGILVSRTIRYVSSEELSLLSDMSTEKIVCDDDILTFTISGIIALIVKWHNSGYAQSEDEMASKMTRLLTCSLMHSDT